MFSSYSGERLLLTLWVGALWTIGFLAVPIAFANLGLIMGSYYAEKLFYAVNLVGVVTATILLLSRLFIFGVRAFARYWRSWLILFMLLLSLVLVLFLQPGMQILKQLGLEDGEQFTNLGKLAVNLYLLLSFFGLLLVLTTDRRAEAVNEV